MSVRDDALTLIRDAAKADDMDAKENNLEHYIWMYRNNIDREEIMEILKELIAWRSLKAAKAVIALKIDAGDGYTESHEDVFAELGGK